MRTHLRDNYEASLPDCKQAGPACCNRGAELLKAESVLLTQACPAHLPEPGTRNRLSRIGGSNKCTILPPASQFGPAQMCATEPQGVIHPWQVFKTLITTLSYKVFFLFEDLLS